MDPILKSKANADQTQRARRLSSRRRGDRVRQTIMAWLFPLGGTLVLLIAFLVALFAR